MEGQDGEVGDLERDQRRQQRPEDHAPPAQRGEEQHREADVKNGSPMLNPARYPKPMSSRHTIQ
jgi:hypothetical protein